MTKKAEQTVFAYYDAKPFLKWAGGKQQILVEIEARLPHRFRVTKSIPKYIEPFVGGGALFFYLKSNYHLEEATILDINPDLVCCYQVVRDDIDGLIVMLEKLEREYLSYSFDERGNVYYQVRKEFNDGRSVIDFNNYDDLWIERAAQMIFLNKTCFNGLYRQNSKGFFNVPQGSYKNPVICRKERLFTVHKALQNTQIISGEFDLVADLVDENTFLYYDPPYRPLDKTSSFNSYAKNGFNDNDQIRLARLFNDLDSIPAYQMLSNSDPKNIDPDDTFFDDLYERFKITRINAKRMINCDGAKRGSITELLITNY